MVYETADRNLLAVRKKVVQAFETIRDKRIDELNIIAAKVVTKECYEKLDKENKRMYLAIAIAAYASATSECKRLGSDPKAETEPTPEWVDEFLNQLYIVTGYLYEPETERKQMRLAEELATANAYKSREEMDSAINTSMRYWWTQTQQYAIGVVDAARMKAFEDCGIKYVMWITQGDEAVCEECAERDGKVYRIDKAPSKMHYGCRCYYKPVATKRG